MNILIAIDSFKGSLSTLELSNAIEQGIHEVSIDFNVRSTPIADGGEGTMNTLVEGLHGEKISIQVDNPIYEKITAQYGMLHDQTAVIEMAASSGLPLISKVHQNPLFTTTSGVGDMIKDAIRRGARTFIIGIGGSATNDAGIGMMHTLGARFYDKEHRELNPIGQSLQYIDSIDITNVMPELKECKFLVACDVDNPLYGENGAAYVYGPQKGASQDTVRVLDEGLRNFAKVVKKELHKDISHIPGAGAAGGLGAGFLAFLNAELHPGVDIIFDRLQVEQLVQWSDIIITGEGKLDFQTSMGKAPSGIGKLAKKHQKIVIALAGSVTDEAYSAHQKGITSMFSILDSPMTLEEAINPHHAKKLVTKSVKELFFLIQAMNQEKKR